MCTCSAQPASRKRSSVPLGLAIPKKDRWCGHFSLKPLRHMACRLSDIPITPRKTRIQFRAFINTLDIILLSQLKGTSWKTKNALNTPHS